MQNGRWKTGAARSPEAERIYIERRRRQPAHLAADARARCFIEVKSGRLLLACAQSRHNYACERPGLQAIGSEARVAAEGV